MFSVPPQVPLKRFNYSTLMCLKIFRAPGEKHCTRKEASFCLDKSKKKSITGTLARTLHDLCISQIGKWAERLCCRCSTVWGQSNKILSLFKLCVESFYIITSCNWSQHAQIYNNYDNYSYSATSSVYLFIYFPFLYALFSLVSIYLTNLMNESFKVFFSTNIFSPLRRWYIWVMVFFLTFNRPDD